MTGFGWHAATASSPTGLGPAVYKIEDTNEPFEIRPKLGYVPVPRPVDLESDKERMLFPSLAQSGLEGIAVGTNHRIYVSDRVSSSRFCSKRDENTVDRVACPEQPSC